MESKRIRGKDEERDKGIRKERWVYARLGHVERGTTLLKKAFGETVLAPSTDFLLIFVSLVLDFVCVLGVGVEHY